jgi:AcrR family transcriptional regulator
MSIDERIVAAAAQVFVDKGYRGASMRDLASALGVQRGSLYHHIESKEELLYAVVLEPVRGIVAALEQIVASDDPVPQRLAAFIDAHVEAMDRHYPHLFVFLQERFPAGGDLPEGRELGELALRYEALVVALIAQGAEDGTLRTDIEPRMAARAVLGMCNWMHKWYRPGRASVAEVASTFRVMALDGLALPTGCSTPDPVAGQCTSNTVAMP